MEVLTPFSSHPQGEEGPLLLLPFPIFLPFFTQSLSQPLPFLLSELWSEFWGMVVRGSNTWLSQAGPGLTSCLTVWHPLSVTRSGISSCKD